MPLTLTDQDIAELQTMLGDFRHKEAVSLIQFFAAKQKAAQIEEAKRAAPPQDRNGHDSNPYREEAKL